MEEVLEPVEVEFNILDLATKTEEETSCIAYLKVVLKKYIDTMKYSDEFLTAYLRYASQSIADFKGVSYESLNGRYKLERTRMAQLMLLKIGAEGQNSHTENGVMRMYVYPDIEFEVLKKLPTTLK